MATNVQVYNDPAADAWSVKVTGDERSETQRFASKDEAVEAGQRLAEERGVELVVHDQRGLQEEKRSEG
ncbi:MAG TPA: DUF2188 domain-containing protein [Actinomycetota bacterium]|nr:DUF2188 domain-containing protein [Actinomycetota bacterium]